jgi:antitoxin component YwqK of YwqJK toxin-antitoxin module
MIKAMLFALFVALLMVGCGESSQPSEDVDMTDTAPKKDAIETAVDWSKLQDRDGVTYLPNTQEPFSGYAKRAYENEQIEVLAELKDGYVVRLKQWQENGIPKWDMVYMEGKVGGSDVPLENWFDSNTHLDGLSTIWYENGQKEAETNWKDGKAEGLYTLWYMNGQKKSEGNWKEGKVMSAKVWKPNGEKCPVTNVKDGNGVLVKYKEDGTEWPRLTFKNGEPVRD